MPSDGPHTRRAAVVVNPTKVSDPEELRESLTSTMAEAGWGSPLWLETTAEDPGYGMTEQALREGVNLVLACGGDGTVRAVLTELAGSGTPLGILPAGTGNLLARNLGLPLADLRAAVEIALSGVDRPIDVGRIAPANRDGRTERFAIMAGVGFDAAMMRDAPELLKARVGWAAYLVSAARNLRGSSVRAQVRIDDGDPIRARARTVLIANVANLPGGLALLPHARPDDGVLDVAIIVSHSIWDWARVLSRVLAHRGYIDNRFTTYRGKQIRVLLRSPQPRQLDGDLIGESTRLAVHLEAGALLVRVPADPATNPRRAAPS